MLAGDWLYMQAFNLTLRERNFKETYQGGKPDLVHTPVPRWDLYAKYNPRVLTVTVQTSRGCPFMCEFCDVIQYVGRTQRHKPTDQILAELASPQADRPNR